MMKLSRWTGLFPWLFNLSECFPFARLSFLYTVAPKIGGKSRTDVDSHRALFVDNDIDFPKSIGFVGQQPDTRSVKRELDCRIPLACRDAAIGSSVSR